MSSTETSSDSTHLQESGLDLQHSGRPVGGRSRHHGLFRQVGLLVLAADGRGLRRRQYRAGLETRSGHARDQSDRVKKQALHWGTLLVGILLIFLMHGAKLFDRPSTPGLLALLLLALTAGLAGVHFNWRMAVVGLILAATFVAAVLAEEFFWILLIVAVIAAVVIFFSRRKLA